MRTVGRYALHDEIASGGMGTVHLGQALGEAGFSRPVAIKRLHQHLARQEEFVHMFMDEARLAARVRHPNVLPTIDLVRTDEGELLVVMEYVHGAPLSALLQKTKEAGRKVPLRIASAIASGLLQGLHAAHEATDEQGHPLGLVHRDVSPQNLMVGVDGATRVLDFGVAKARGRLQASTGEGMLKGKIGYLAPELIRGADVDRASDVYSASVVIWELLTGKRLYPGDNEGHVLEQILVGWVDPPSKWVPELSEELDRTILRGLLSDPTKRFKSARELAIAIERCVPAAPPMEVGEWVERTAWDLLEPRAKAIAAFEHGGATPQPKPETTPTRVDRPLDKQQEAPSSISVSQPLEARPSRRRRVAVAVLLLLLGVAVVIGAMRRRGDDPVKNAGPAVTHAPFASPSSSAVAPLVPPAASLVPAEVPAPSSSAASPSIPAEKPKSVAKPSAKPSPPPSALADCTPPWTVDSLGRRIYKRHCLHAP